MSSAANPQPSSASTPQGAGPALGAAVLVIEDDMRSARVLSAHLQGAGYRVTVIDSAIGAQSTVGQALPDLILCDVCLPQMDGIQFTRWFRETYPGANVPIALITSSDDGKILSRGLDAGADDFLTKPVNSLELRTRARSLLRSKMLADELRERERVAIPFRAQEPARASDAKPQVREACPPSAIIIEDNPHERRLLLSHLTELHCDTRAAGSVAAGLALVKESVPDLIVLDLLLPDQNGYEFISALKRDPNCSHASILVVSAMSEVRDRVKALELGADDFIVKGFERVEFEARVKRLLRLKKSLDRLSDRCDHALRLAVTDSLTGLFTKGFMHETLESQLSFAQRYRQPYSVIFVDIDHFKNVNDRHGHVTGDVVLQAVADTLRRIVRQSDTLVRYGGEEFVILAPHTDREAAMTLAERMRAAVAALSIPVDGAAPLRVTMSLGVATYPEDAIEGQALVHRGDSAMYMAKQTARNCVVAWAEGTAAQACGAYSPPVDDNAELAIPAAAPAVEYY